MANEYIQKARLDHGDKDLKNTKYPFAQVWETESGHVLMLDDTPEGPKIFLASESGSYILMTTDGKVVNFTVGDQQNYAKGGLSATVDENMDLKVHGHTRVTVGGGSYVEVAGHAGIGVGGDVALVAEGNLNASVDNVYIGAKGDFNINAEGNMNVKVKGNQTTTVKGETQHTSDGDNTIKANNIKLNP